MKIVFFGGRHTVELLTSLNSTNDVLIALTTDKLVINSAVSSLDLIFNISLVSLDRAPLVR